MRLLTFPVPQADVGSAGGRRRGFAWSILAVELDVDFLDIRSLLDMDLGNRILDKKIGRRLSRDLVMT